MNIGIIGYGELGSRLATRLTKNNFKVYGYDISETAVQNMKDDNIISLSSPAQVAGQCDYIITCVDDESSVKQCILGENGLIEGLKKDSIIIEMTTSLPKVTTEVGIEIKEKGAHIIDAPVSRGIPAAETGTLSILVGGKKSVFEKCRNILEKLGTDIIYCGDLGSGHAVKAINMMMMACNLLATIEVVTLGQKDGLKIENILNVINASSGENYITSHHYPKYVLSETYLSKFSLGLMDKDLNIALKMAKDKNMTPLMGQRAASIYDLLKSKLSLDIDNMESVNEIQSWMGEL